jgi:hypothetical protein
MKIAPERGKILSDSSFMVKRAEGLPTIDVMNKFCRPKQLNHVAKLPLYNVDMR